MKGGRRVVKGGGNVVHWAQPAVGTASARR
jgi:hypothetical protein